MKVPSIYALILACLVFVDSTYSNIKPDVQLSIEQLSDEGSEAISESRQKRLAVAAVIAGAAAVAPIVSALASVGSFIYGIVNGQQRLAESRRISQQLVVMQTKIDQLSSQLAMTMSTILKGQQWLEGAVIYARDIQRLKYILHRLNEFSIDEHGVLQPSDRVQAWADDIMSLRGMSIGQLLYNMHDMMVGTTHLFGNQPLYRVFRSRLAMDENYWLRSKQFIEFTYVLQVAGYAAWATALNIKGDDSHVQISQGHMRERLADQQRTLEALTLHWPAGLYGLPKPKSGCPGPAGNDWQAWVSGWRYHDTEDHHSANRWSANNHFAGAYGKNNMNQTFCMRRSPANVGADWRGSGAWPPGSYCIFRQGGSCPRGFQNGAIHWDDEDRNNKNKKGGVLPDGDYGRNTLIHFCCRSDRSYTTPISLPTERPFYLFRYRGGCQRVADMTVQDEWFHWDDEDRKNRDDKDGAHPDDSGDSENHELHFCYYN